MRVRNIILFCILLLIYYSAICSTDIETQFVRQVSLYPQEKLYVLNDKPQYVAGEDIWFRAFLTDNISLLPDTTSRYVYGELISPHDSVLCRVKVNPKEGAYYGYITIPESTPAGVYELCFHTKYMENLGEDYFFRRQILVGAPFSGMYRIDSKFFHEDTLPQVTVEMRILPVSGGSVLIPDEFRIKDGNGNLMRVDLVEGNLVRLRLDPDKDIKNNALYVEYDYEGKTHKEFLPVPSDERSYVVSFFPEGGHLLSGTLTQIGFKALKSNGLGESVSGYILNSSGDTISYITSNILGMGSFPLKAEKGETYTAVCKNSKGIEKRFSLPLALDEGFALQAKSADGKLNVRAITSGGMSFPSGMRLFVQCRGVPVYNEELDEHTPFVSFDKSSLPTGILHILLLDSDNTPLSERLVFNLNEGYAAHTDFTTDKSDYGRRELITCQLQLTDIDGTPLEGSLAVTVTDSHDVLPDTTNNIISELLLSSELRGYIEYPSYYFNDDSRIADLDYLMMTQGWSRYDIPSILRGEIIEPTIPIETGPGISGYVREGLSGRAAVNASVLLMSMDSIPYHDIVLTDKEGRFMFNNFDLPDSTQYLLQVTNKKGKRGSYELHMDDKPITSVTRRLAWEPVKIQEDRVTLNNYMQKAERRFTDEHGIRTINIKEIVVTSKRPERVAMSYSVYSSPFNYAIRGEDYPNEHSTKKLVSNLPGVYYKGQLYSPIVISKGKQGPPLIIMDGVRIRDDEFLYSLPPSLIEEVELVVGSRMALFGLEGGQYAGALIVTTKKAKDRPNELSPNMKTVTPWGYQVKKEFYSPVYETKEQYSSPKSDLRTTIYWSPDIKTDDNGCAEIEFYSADSPSTYTVIIEGITKTGKPIYNISKISRNR